MQNSNYVVIGAGPAGLTAALELLRKGYTNVTHHRPADAADAA